MRALTTAFISDRGIVSMPKSSLAAWRRRRFPSLFAALAMVAVVSACDSSTGNDDDIASLTVTPPTPVLNIGSVQQLVATPTTATGRIVNATVSWNSDAPGVATVDGNGLVTALAGGTANISATVGGETATAVLTVWYPVQTVALAATGGITTINQESSVQLIPSFTDATGAAVTGRQVEWTTSNPAAATVTPTGLVIGRSESAATATITATSLNGVVGTINITSSGAPLVATVTLASTAGRYMTTGNTDQFIATARSAIGTVLSLTGRTVNWTTANAAVATVSATGLVTMLVNDGTSSAIRVSVDGVNSNNLTAVGVPELTSGVPVVSGTVAADARTRWIINVPSAGSLVTTFAGGSGDPDLSVWRANNLGTTALPAAESGYTSGNSGPGESVTRAVSTAMAGRWVVELWAWPGAGAATGTTVTSTFTPTP